jgi:hypothetical protein
MIVRALALASDGGLGRASHDESDPGYAVGSDDNVYGDSNKGNGKVEDCLD